MAELSPSPGGAHNLAEWRPCPSGLYARVAPMAERRLWQREAHGRAEPIVGRRAWQSGLYG